MTRFVTQYDNEEYEVAMRGDRHMCCDCGLVHDNKFRRKGRRLYVKSARNARATAAARRRFNFSKEND